MELKLDNRIYITSPELFPNMPKDEELRETHQMSVFIDAINIYDFEYKGDEKQTKEAYLKHLVFKEAEKKYDHVSEIPKRLNIEIAERLNIELELTFKNGWTDYFLATHKLVQNAKKLANAFIYQITSSSGTNSLICYCLGFHYCDPIKYGLCYERFFYSEYLALAIGMDRQSLKRFSKILRNNLGHFSEQGEKIIDPDRPKPLVKTYYKFRKWESVEHIGLWSCNQLEKVHALCKEVKKQYGEVVTPNTISTNNQKTLELFRTGEIEGIYYEWEKESMRNILIDYQPDSFNDLVALNSLFHSEFDKRRTLLVKCKQGKRLDRLFTLKDFFAPNDFLSCGMAIVTAMNSRLFEYGRLLRESYGLIIFQEQMIALAQEIPDFTLEESIKLLKLFCKKDNKSLEKFEKQFYDIGHKKNYRLKGLKSLWKEWSENSIYYYPKCLATSKTSTLFQIAFFKTHYRKAFDEVCKKIW